VLNHDTAKVPFNAWELSFLLLLFCFSAWLMFQSFSYDHETNNILIGVKIWSDFGATLPLIRSFSLGDNWPPEYPIYPGLPIQYHYFFYLLVGLLERAGVPLHWALNVPSTLGFFLVLLMTYLIARRLFEDRRVGALSVVFFLFNGSLSFLQYFAKHPPLSTPLEVLLAPTDYTAMGPWDGGKVLGVWHLNVFINQRHFCLSLGILLAFVFACAWLGTKTAKRRDWLWALPFGVLIGFMPVLHRAVLLMFAVEMALLFLLVARLRVFLLLTGVVSVTVMAVLWALSFFVATTPAAVSWYPGFTIHNSLSVLNAIGFFWYQFGIHCVLIPVGFAIAPKRARVFALPALVVVALAFLFKFSDEVLVGHKFFNFFLALGQMFSALVVVRLFAALRRRISRFDAALAVSPLVLVATLSGLLDFVPIAKMDMIQIADVEKDERARFFAEHTERDAVVLTSGMLYTAPSIAGRKIFIGWPYFTMSAGYDTNARMAIRREIYATPDVHVVCGLLEKHDIDWVELENIPEDRDRPPIDVAFFASHYQPEYGSNSGYAVYSTKAMCEVARSQRGAVR
jgi:hypothetical protein